MAKKQVKLYFEESFIEDLSNDAVRYGRRSGNAVAEEILAKFLPIWRKVEEGKLQAVAADYEAQEAPRAPLRKVK